MYKIFTILYILIGTTFGGIISNNDIRNSFSSYGDDEYDYDNYDMVLEPECKLTAFPPLPNSTCCGVDVSSKDRIVGGSVTLIDQYPWLALIEYKVQGWRKLQAKCGGSLISGLYVLTAAHCVAGDILKKSTPRNVVLGDFDKYQDGEDCETVKEGQKDKGPIVHCTDGEVRIPVAKYIAHGLYTKSPTHNDIALIKLKEVAPYTNFIRPICLPTSDLTLSDHKNLWLTIAGWGTMKQVKTEAGYTGTTSSVKRQLQLPYVPLSKCKKTWRNAGPGHICAGGLKGQDACMGDSGGPLMLSRDDIYELTGAVSYGAGKPCGKADHPGVYTNVYQYKRWIMNIISLN